MNEHQQLFNIFDECEKLPNNEFQETGREDLLIKSEIKRLHQNILTGELNIAKIKILVTHYEVFYCGFCLRQRYGELLLISKNDIAFLITLTIFRADVFKHKK